MKILKKLKIFDGSKEVSGCEKSRNGVRWEIICLCNLGMGETGKCEEGLVKIWVSDEKINWKKWLGK